MEKIWRLRQFCCNVEIIPYESFDVEWECMNTFYIPNLQLFTCIIGGRYQCLRFIAQQIQGEALYLPEFTQLDK